MSKLKENKINFTKNAILNLSLPNEGKIGYYYDKVHDNFYLGVMQGIDKKVRRKEISFCK